MFSQSDFDEQTQRLEESSYTACMESPLSWDLVTSSLMVVPFEHSAQRMWAFLLLQGLVVESPEAMRSFEHIVAEIRSQVLSAQGWATGPSPASAIAYRLKALSIVSPAGLVPDPEALLAKARFAVTKRWQELL